MNPDKELTRTRLSRWFQEKFRDEIEVKSQYDKKVFSLIMALIGSNGKPLYNDSSSVKKQLDEIQATVEGIEGAILVDEQFDALMAAIDKNRPHEPTNEVMLVEKLKIFMAVRNLKIHDVAGLIKKNPRTVWQFLNELTTPQNDTIYKIKELLGKG